MNIQNPLPQKQQSAEISRTAMILVALARKLGDAQRRWHSARYLCAMNDNALRDIGMHRSQIIASAHNSARTIVHSNENTVHGVDHA
ncbi:MAG: DUF1127 domain-containing protein [Rhodospirillales bacterium]|jgi:uncharacterized protein YjiS (DUF1127 family)|nr:DUF1127 domain-containing protein [Rhodospirillales bacterium]MBT4041778.1 DUF1127 domain-containing protein [Rhodospirillales bacterium]MBT4628492.1 DUF1127 domain-containing protein [Rhodospirillales bacterium]MBT5351096.1 DUF1127 domain-containing protein [Rhodospirillales bacterium]MBT5520660.1 DUF1127 domain-containing protein [Rhodospirillales bacterium]